LTGNLKNTMKWPRNLLINTENIVVSGETIVPNQISQR
jgi:hypothetical protein